MKVLLCLNDSLIVYKENATFDSFSTHHFITLCKELITCPFSGKMFSVVGFHVVHILMLVTEVVIFST